MKEEGVSLTEPPKKRRRRQNSAAKKRRIVVHKKGLLLANKKPSYCLKQGISSHFSGENLQSYHRKRLWQLLKKLMLQHNWTEASGVMAVLLQATVNDTSPSRNRAKYSAALELLNHIKNVDHDHDENERTLTTSMIISSKKRLLLDVYDLWADKICPVKGTFPKHVVAVKLESIISCLQLGMNNYAYLDARELMKECRFARRDPVSNLVVGLTYYQMWYNNNSSSSIPKELQLNPYVNVTTTHMQSDVFMDNIDDAPLETTGEGGGGGVDSRVNSNTSVANDKEEAFVHSISCPGFVSGDVHHASIFDTQRVLPPWLLPLKILPNSNENYYHNMDNLRKDEDYKHALKHLRVALYSKPPLLEALHPLIQMLLLGDQVREALDEFEKLFHSSGTLTVVQLRLKATLVEHFEPRNCSKLCTCFEDILKKDPTCSDSLARLILLHRRGDYETRNLVEMIALHLDATRGTHDTWKELSSCFLILSQGEEDRASTCREYFDNSNKIADLFTDRDSMKNWRSRCRWWLRRRHFCDKILISDIASGDLELLTYKASTASYLYGRHFEYVVKATECVEKENNVELYSVLQIHIQNNSIGFYDVKKE